MKDGGESFGGHWFLHIDSFRNGHIDNHNALVQNAWYTFCDKIMVAVNNHWKQTQTRTYKLMSSQCTVSDEAFAYLVGKCHIMFWLERHYNKQKKKDDMPWKEAKRNGLEKDVNVEEPNDETLVDSFTDEVNNDNDNGDGINDNVRSDDTTDSDNKNKIHVVDYVAKYNELKNQKSNNPEDWNSWDAFYMEALTNKQKNISRDTANSDSGKVRRNASKEKQAGHLKKLAMDYEDWD